MRGDEARVVAAFCEWLTAEGWDVTTEVAFCDVVAHRDGVTLYAEAKGRTTDPGLDTDTMYGQLLRRIGDDHEPGTRYGVVVPTEAVGKVLRVSARVRETLRIDIYEVTADGNVLTV